MSISLSMIFFRIVNTLALFGLIAYLFKKYMLSSIKRAIAHREAISQSLINQEQQLLNQQQALNKSFIDQQGQAEDLQQKVLLWHRHETHLQELKRDERAHAIEKSRERKNVQQEIIQRTSLQKKVIKPAIKEAHDELKAVFENTQKGQAYLNKLITLLPIRDA